MIKRYKLKIIAGPVNIGEEYFLKEGTMYELRRAGSNISTNNEVIYLEDSEVSKLQSVIRVLPGELIVEDSNSTNGTFVNGAQVDQAVLLSDYRLRVGNTEFVVLPIDSSGAILFKNSQVYSKDLNDFMRMIKLLGDSILYETPQTLDTNNQLIQNLYKKHKKTGDLVNIKRPVVPDIKSYHFKIELENKKTGSKRSYILYRRTFIIGRSVDPEKGLITLDKGVSQEHVKITIMHNKQFKVEDLNSVNGLFVNNIRVSKAVIKSGGDFLMSSTVVTVTLFDDVL